MASINVDNPYQPPAPRTPEEQAAIDAYYRSLTGGSEQQAADYLNNNTVPGNVANNQGNVSKLYAPMNGGPSVLTNTTTPTSTDTPPPTDAPGPGTGGGSGAGLNVGPTAFDWPTFTAPTFTAPAPFTFTPLQAPTPFSYADFTAPSLQDAQNAPGYQFARDQGVQALENSAAAKGVLRSGGTLKDILQWGDQFAQQNYQNVFNNAANVYTTNRNNAFDNWNANNATALADWQANTGAAANAYTTNYGVSRDVFDRTYQGALDTFNSKERQAELTFTDMYNRWRDQLNALTNVASGA